MLGKLIKYEFRATRKMLLLYGLLLILAAVMAVIFRFGLVPDIISNEPENPLGFVWFAEFIVSAAYSFMNAFIFAAVLFSSINRFRLNLLGNQGYLMHTLPVKSGQHILAKNIVSLSWTIISVIALLISYMIVGIGFLKTDFLSEFGQLFVDSYSQSLFTSARFWLVFAGFIIFGIISVSDLYFRIYASMAAGYSLNNHRAAASIGAFIALSIVKSIPHGILMSYLPDAMNLASIEWKFLIFEIIYSAVWALVYYFIAAWFLNKRLNLQ